MRMKSKKEYSKYFRSKVFLLFFLFVIFVLNLYFVSVKRHNKTQVESTEISSQIMEKETQTEIENSSDSDALNEKYFIDNLDVYATPLLEEKVFLLNSELLNFCSETEIESTSAEIFYVSLSEENLNHLFFFVKLLPSNEIVQMTFDYATDTISVMQSVYSEEEIKNEIWNGDAPAIRDIQ